jgi:hypothetical protein
MATETHPGSVAFDRRQVYRPFLESLNPIASPGIVAEHNWIVSRSHDPRDAEEPPIHESLATSAELNRGIQMALVGGIGSGKTTELLLTRKLLDRHADAVNIYVDMAEFTDLSQINPGAILAVAGMQIYEHLQAIGQKAEEVDSAHAKLRELAFGKTIWTDDQRDYETLALNSSRLLFLA